MPGIAICRYHYLLYVLTDFLSSVVRVVEVDKDDLFRAAE